MRRLSDILWRTLHYWKSVRIPGDHAGTPDVAEAGSIRNSIDVFQHPEKKFLHVGCGSARKPDVSQGFRSDEWREIRLDIDPAADPDIVSSILDMAAVPTASVDALYSSHNIEHLYPHEVPLALAEFLRVLKPDGVLVLTCPDLQSVSQLVLEDKLTEEAYLSAVGPIAPLDILYGHRPQMAAGNLFMAHRTGFTLRTLVDSVRTAGFRSVAGRKRAQYFDLWIVATGALLPNPAMQVLADTHLPQ